MSAGLFGLLDDVAALAALSAIGPVAMLWVGDHILLVGTDTLGWHPPYGFVHHLEHGVRHATGGAGGVLACWPTPASPR